MIDEVDKNVGSVKNVGNIEVVHPEGVEVLDKKSELEARKYAISRSLGISLEKLESHVKEIKDFFESNKKKVLGRE